MALKLMVINILLILIQNAFCDIHSFDCPMRQLALDFAQDIQPWLTMQQLQQVADALNGAQEANNCSVSPSKLPYKPTNERPVHEAPIWSDLISTDSYSDHIFVDYINGNDNNDGSINYPLKLLQTAIIKARKQRSNKHETQYIILREGRHYLQDTIYLDSNDNNLIITNFNGENAEISGAKPLTGCDWKEYKQGENGLNYYQCQITNDSISYFTGLRVNGKRAVRARYPNAIPEIDGFGSNIFALSWMPSTLPSKPDILIYPQDYPVRNDSAGKDNVYHEPYFWYYNLGIGGPCQHFVPNAGYWCSGQGQGGYYPHPWYCMTTGLTYNSTILPNTPYANTENGIIQAWHPAHWATWMFEIGEYDPDKQTMKFLRGGYQGARGAGFAGEIYVDNIFEELDMPSEWYFNKTTRMLYYYNNDTQNDPNKLQFEYTDLKVLVNYSNTKDITLRGMTIRDSAKTFMDDHGMPSGGDWALQRTGAIYIENSERITIENNLFTRLDGIAISINRYTRNITVYKNEIVWNGATAISSWGDTFINDSRVPHGMGYDGTKGTQPRFNNISYNFVHELGIWEKQSSLYFQAKSCQNFIGYNIFFNGPRAGINFNDGFGGGSTLHKNLLFNTCRESGDHGPFNSWDRQVFVTSVRDGTPSVIKDWDHLSKNFFLANYHSSMAIDNDDGSCFYHSHENFLVYAPCGLKNNFGGHSNYHYNNTYAYIGSCLQTDQDMNSGQLAGYNDLYQNNTCVINGNPGSYGQWNCTYDTDRWPLLGNNNIYTLNPENNHTGLCGLNEMSFQAKYNMDIGTKILGPISDTDLLNHARQMLFS